TDEQLLTCLTSSIKCTLYLSTTKRAVAQHTTIFPCERYTLCHTLVDDIGTYLCQAIYIGLTRTIVTTFDGVIEKTVHAVTIVLIVFCGIDTTLCRDRVGTTRRILKAKRFNFITQFAQRSSSRSSGQTGTDYDYFQIALIGRVYDFTVIFIIRPFLR